MKTVKISPQNFTVWYQLTNQVYGRFCSINFRTLHLVISLRTVKFCRHFFHFSFFLLPNFLAKTTKNTVKHEKLPYVRKIFRKLDPFFFPESPKFALFWGGVALNFLELPNTVRLTLVYCPHKTNYSYSYSPMEAIGCI